MAEESFCPSIGVHIGCDWEDEGWRHMHKTARINGAVDSIFPAEDLEHVQSLELIFYEMLYVQS